MDSCKKHDIHVSSVIPAFNAENTLKRAIESLLQQTYKNHEIIIVDDGSTDKTAEIIRHFSEVTFFSHSHNQGVVSSLQTGMAAASGELIARMDADDWCHPERLEKASRSPVFKSLMVSCEKPRSARKPTGERHAALH